jgi:hypothetical protein
MGEFAGGTLFCKKAGELATCGLKGFRGIFEWKIVRYRKFNSRAIERG